MNEQKKMHNDYFHPTVSKQEQNVGEILNLIQRFMENHKHELRAADFVVLESLIKQLGKRKTNFPRKVLRSMQVKFENIKSKYQNLK